MMSRLGLLIAIAALSWGTFTVLAAKPNSNTAGATTYAWHLSGNIMPAPHSGSQDLPGSDTDSKLIVSRTNGNVSTTATGTMKGLDPNTTYTVYLSKPYDPSVITGWNVAGAYTIKVTYLAKTFNYDLTLTQTGNTVGGTLDDTYQPANLPVTGTVTGNTLAFSVTYASTSIGTRTFTGDINESGNISGTWTETGSEKGSGVWSTTSGTASNAASWPVQLAGTSPFTFTTNGAGSGNWHYNFTGEFTPFSVWINNGDVTVLVSDNITN